MAAAVALTGGGVVSGGVVLGGVLFVLVLVFVDELLGVPVSTGGATEPISDVVRSVVPAAPTFEKSVCVFATVPSCDVIVFGTKLVPFGWKLGAPP